MAIDMNKAVLWEGIEIEGRLRGLLTVFAGNPATVNDLRKIRLHECEHIYLNEEVIFKDGVFEYLRQLPRRIIISLSFYNPSKIAELPKDLLQRCHIVLVFECPALSLLKTTDMVKIEVGSYHNFQTTKQCFGETLPEEYEEDAEWQ